MLGLKGCATTHSLRCQFVCLFSCFVLSILSYAASSVKTVSLTDEAVHRSTSKQAPLLPVSHCASAFTPHCVTQQWLLQSLVAVKTGRLTTFAHSTSSSFGTGCNLCSVSPQAMSAAVCFMIDGRCSGSTAAGCVLNLNDPCVVTSHGEAVLVLAQQSEQCLSVFADCWVAVVPAL